MTRRGSRPRARVRRRLPETCASVYSWRLLVRSATLTWRWRRTTRRRSNGGVTRADHRALPAGRRRLRTRRQFLRPGMSTRASSSWSTAPCSGEPGRLPDGSTTFARPATTCTCELPGGEPIVVVRGADRSLRAFYNVCRHHAAAVVTDAHGSATAVSMSLSRMDVRRSTDR